MLRIHIVAHIERSKIMRIKSLIIASGLSLAVMIGIGANFVKQDVKAVKATVATSDTELFVDTGALAWWSSDDVTTKVWEYNEGKTVQHVVDTTLIDGTLFSFTLKANCEKFVFQRTAKQGGTVHNESWEVTHDTDYNFYNFTGETNSKADYERKYIQHYEAGDSIYLDVQDKTVSSWWGSINSYAYFVAGSTTSWYQFNQVDDTNLHLHTFEDDAYAAQITIVRNETASFDGKDNQTSDIGITSGNHASNGIALGSDVGGGYINVAKMEAYDDAFVADSFACYFLNQNICLDGGGLADGYATAWANAYHLVEDLLSP